MGKVQLVSTQCSDLDNPSDHLTPYSMAPPELGKAEQLRLEKYNLDQARNNLTYKMRAFTEDDVEADDLPLAHEKLKEVNDMFCSIWCHIDHIVAKFSAELGSDESKALQDLVAPLKAQVKTHERSIRAKIKTSAPAPRQLSSYEVESLEIQRKLMEIELNKERRGTAESKIMVSTKAAQVRDKLRNLETCIKLVETRDKKDYWKTVNDLIITRSMKELTKWDTIMTDTDEKFLELQELVKLHGEPPDASDTGYDFAAIKDLVLDMRLDIVDAKAAVQAQDKERSLFSLERSKGQVLKYPTFTGEDGEDLVKFKEKMEYRFKMNQVPQRLQLEKLRESLQGQALKQVPDSTKDIAAAWANLSDAFGDPSRVLQHRINILREMGDFPAKAVRGAPNHAKRVEFLLKLEGVVRDIVDLGNSDQDLMLLSFNANTIAEVVNKFPDTMVLELNGLPGRGKQRMSNILDKLSKFRADAQSLEKTRSHMTPVKGAAKQSEKREEQSGLHNEVSAQINYNPPKREPNCRICLQLRDVENKNPVPNSAFFEGHLSNYVTGCQQFIAMDMTERFSIIRDVNMCEKCFHPEVTYSRDHEQECSIKEKKSSFSCSKCTRHSWICKNHKEQNKAKLDKFKKDYRDRYKVKLVFAVVLPSSPAALATARPAAAPATLASPGSATAPGTSPSASGSIPLVSSHNLTSGEDIGTAKAFKAMKKRLKANGFKGDMKPPPEGEPMFLFFGAQGRNKPVNIMFDSGCSHAVFRDGIPGKELKGMITHRGPFHMKGVGGILTKANDQWLCALDTPGAKQFVSGLTVDRVTGDFPLIQLDKAAQELKADKAEDQFLQNCTLPPSAGGVTDVLMGIMYSNTFPVLVHSLPSGLAIYKTVLSSHGNKYNCMIGGPHRSFEQCAGHAGGVSQMLAHFTEGIKQYRSWGPPKLDSLPMTCEELRFAQELNS